VAARKETRADRKPIVVHRKARFRFEILETVEAGLVLRGTEVKALRQGLASLEEAFGRVYGDELFLVGAHIQEYSHGNQHNHEPTRKRKLLLRRREIRKLAAKIEQQGLTLVPLSLYFNERGLAKVELGLGKGRKLHDKREVLKKREAARELRNA
jgi:SsrA-binding protein